MHSDPIYLPIPSLCPLPLPTSSSNKQTNQEGGRRSCWGSCSEACWVTVGPLIHSFLLVKYCLETFSILFYWQQKYIGFTKTIEVSVVNIDTELNNDIYHPHGVHEKTEFMSTGILTYTVLIYSLCPLHFQELIHMTIC